MQGLSLFLVPFLLTSLAAEEAQRLERGKPVERDLAHPAVHAYTVPLETGEVLRAAIDQRGVDVVVTLFGPDGSRIAEIDSPNGTSGPEPIELLAPATGTYRIEVRAFDAETPAGKYEAKISSILTAAEHAAEIAAERAAQEATSKWIAANAIPLRTAEAGNGFADMQPLKAVVGDAHVVSLGEATHGTREFFQFKHRMLELLVTQMGFTVFGIEATMPESFDVNEYVLTGRGDARKALGALYFWTWNTEEVLQMIEWMRQYNADPAHKQKVKFYGFDMQFPVRAVEVIQQYLRKVDPEEAAAVESDLAILANPFTETLLDSQPGERRAAVATAVARVLKSFDDRKEQYVRKSSASQYAISRQHARILQQNMESRNGPPNVAGLVRDRAMAENIRWILDHEGPGTKMVLWAHNGHVTTADEQAMGAYLRKALGRDMVVMGFAFNQGSFQAVQMGERRLDGLRSHSVSPAPAGTLDAVLAAAALPMAAIDLRSLPKEGPVPAWLGQPRQTRSIGSVYSEQWAARYLQKVNVKDAYDALVFFDKTTTARANPEGKIQPPFLTAPMNLDFEAGEVGSAPPGWWIPPQLVTFDFVANTTAENPRSGKKCLTIRRGKGKHYGAEFGSPQQVVEATAYRGQRVRLRAAVRTAVEGPGNQAHLWLRAQNNAFAPAKYADACDRPITSPEWQIVELVTDVDKEADVLAFGLALVGDGQAWLDDVSLEVVSP